MQCQYCNHYNNYCSNEQATECPACGTVYDQEYNHLSFTLKEIKLVFDQFRDKSTEVNKTLDFIINELIDRRG